MIHSLSLDSHSAPYARSTFARTRRRRCINRLRSKAKRQCNSRCRTMASRISSSTSTRVSPAATAGQVGGHRRNSRCRSFPSGQRIARRFPPITSLDTPVVPSCPLERRPALMVGYARFVGDSTLKGYCLATCPVSEICRVQSVPPACLPSLFAVGMSRIGLACADRNGTDTC